MVKGEGGKEKNIRLYSLPIKQKPQYAPLIDLVPDYSIDTESTLTMNSLELTSGRLPLNDTEVALDVIFENSLELSLGDMLTFSQPAAA